MLDDRGLDNDKNVFVRMWTQAWPRTDGYRRVTVRTMLSDERRYLFRKLGITLNANVNFIDLAIIQPGSQLAVRTGRDGNLALLDRAALN